jgi:hypothetical protein
MTLLFPRCKWETEKRNGFVGGGDREETEKFTHPTQNERQINTRTVNNTMKELVDVVVGYCQCGIVIIVVV